MGRLASRCRTQRRGLSRFLKPYGIAPKQVRIGDTTVKGYPAQSFDDAWSRYVPAAVGDTRNKRNIRNAPGRDVSDVSGVSDALPSSGPPCQLCTGPPHDAITHRYQPQEAP